MLKKLLFLFAILAGTLATAQDVLVQGTVVDKNGSPQEFVSVVCVEQPIRSQLTSATGQYKLNLAYQDTLTLRFSFLGKSTERVLIAPNKNEVLDVTYSFGVDLGTATINEKGPRTQPMEKLEPKVFSGIPSVGGGIEALLTQTFVNRNNELSASYSVRGGSFDENLVYVNDIQVYRPFLVRAGEQEGLSFPNPDMVESIEFSAGGFEARFGDRLSSVLDIQYKRPTDFGGSVTASFLGGAIQVEGADSTFRRDGKAAGLRTFNIGTRYRNNSYVLGSLDTEGDYRPRYIDFQSYLTWDITDLWEVSFLGNYSENLYNFVPTTRETNLGTINEALRFTVFFEGQEVSTFETYFGALTSTHRISSSTQLRFIGSYFNTFEQETFDILGEYFLDELERDLGSDEFGEVLRNRGVGGFLNHGRNELNATVINFAANGITDFEKSKHVMRYGAKWQTERFMDELSEWSVIDSSGFSSPRPPDQVGIDGGSDIIAVRDLIKAQNDVSNQTITGFVQDSWDWKNKDTTAIWNANIGARFNYRTLNGQLVGGPRGSLSYHRTWEKESQRKDNGSDTTVVKDIVWRFSGGYYFQPPFFKELRGIDGTVNNDVRAQRAIHAVIGADYIFTAYDRPFKLVAEAYYKDLNFLVPYELENVRLRYYGDNLSRGYATGLDLLINGEFIKDVQSWIKVSFLRTAEDLFDDFYTRDFNDDGAEIIPGFTANDSVVRTEVIEPGFIPRPTDQRVNFSMFFQDRMKRWPKYRIQLVMHYGTGLPYGPPDFERYKDVARTPSYKRVDVGFVRELVSPYNKNEGKNFFSRNVKESFISLEVFNLLAIRNTINHTWIEDVTGRLYSVPNFLTGRRINLKFVVKF